MFKFFTAVMHLEMIHAGNDCFSYFSAETSLRQIKAMKNKSFSYYL